MTDDVTNDHDNEPETFHTAGANIGSSRLSRRGFMRVATAGGAIAAAGGVSLSHNQFDVVEKAKAAPILPLLPVAAAAGYGGAYSIDNFFNEPDDIDLSDADESQARLEAISSAQTLFYSSEADWTSFINSWRLNIEYEDSYEDAGYDELYPYHRQELDWGYDIEELVGDLQHSAYLNQAWSEIRAYIDQQYQNGISQTDAVDNCIDDVLIPQSIRAFSNISESYNGRVRSHAHIERQLQQNGINDQVGRLNNVVTSSDVSDGNTIENLQDDFGVFDDGESPILLSYPLDFEIPLSEVDGAEETEWNILVLDSTAAVLEPIFKMPFVNMPDNSSDWSSTNDTIGVRGVDDEYDPITDHSSEERDFWVTIPTVLYHAAFKKLELQYDQLLGDIIDYADTVYATYDAGEAEPGDAITAQDLVEYRDDADQTDRLTAELAAAGYLTQEQLTNQQTVTVEHSDIETEDGQATGLLYIDSQDDITVSEGETIAAENYNGAYLAEPADGDEVETMLLSGNENLTIIETETDEPLDYEQWIPSVNDPTDPDEFQSYADETAEMREEIEALREQMAEEQATGGGGIALPSNPLSGISNTAAAAGAGVIALIFGSIALGGGD